MNSCEKIMNDFLQLDKNEHLPLHVTLHLLACKKCRTQIRMCTLAEKVAAKPLNARLPLDNPTTQAIMKTLENANVQNVTCKTKEGKKILKPVSLFLWALCGVFIIVALCFYGINIKNIYFQAISVPFYLVFAMIVTAYCTVFVRSNVDYFVKKFITLKTI